MIALSANDSFGRRICKAESEPAAGGVEPCMRLREDVE
jgi:hypothetical protein